MQPDRMRLTPLGGSLLVMRRPLCGGHVPVATNSGWSSSRSQEPSGCRRATCARAPAPSFGAVEVRAISPLLRVGSGDSCSK